MKLRLAIYLRGGEDRSRGGVVEGGKSQVVYIMCVRVRVCVCVQAMLNVLTHTSGVLDLFLPLKNSGSARFSIA